MSNQFPVYKKYFDEKSFFEILNASEFNELKITGKTFSVHQIKAKILPERVLIHDMLDNENLWKSISMNEYFEKLDFCRKNLKEIKV